MPARHIIALWETVHEPRAVTITYMIMYALAATAGATIAANPRHGILTGAPPWVVVVIVAMLIAGGLVGVPVAWRGDRWLERSVVIMVGSAIGLMLLNATMIAPHIAPLSPPGRGGRSRDRPPMDDRHVPHLRARTRPPHPSG